MFHCWCAVLAVETAGVVHQDYVRVARIFQDGFNLGGEALLVTLEASPAVIAGIEPEKCGLTQRLGQRWGNRRSWVRCSANVAFIYG